MNAREVMEALLKGEQVGEVHSSSYVELDQGGHLTRSPGMTQDQIAYIFTHSSCCEIKRKCYALGCSNKPGYTIQNDRIYCFSCLQPLLPRMSEEQFKAVKPL